MSEEHTYEIARAHLGGYNPETRQPIDEGLLGALNDFAANKIPLPLRERIHRAKGVVNEEINTREELKQELVQQHRSEGDKWTTLGEAPEDFLEEYVELMGRVVEMDLGPPITLNGESVDIDMDQNSFEILRNLGFLELEVGD